MPIVQSRSLRPIITTSTLDPGNKASTISLSNGNLTATCITAITPEPQVGSTSGRTSGKLHFEVTMNVFGGAFLNGFGVGSASNHAITTFVGGDNFSVGLFFSGSSVRYFAGNAIQHTYSGTGIGANDGDVYAFEIDIGLGKIWVMNVTKGSGWNGDILANENPATNTGGFDGSTWLGGVPLLIYIDLEAVGAQDTLNTGGSTFAGTPSSGFSAWL